LSAPPSPTTSTESATSATVRLGSMARLTGGPTTEFFNGKEARIRGLSGSARSTIRHAIVAGRREHRLAVG